METNKKIKSCISRFSTTDVTYHRNGVGGKPFYSVRFSYTDVSFSPECYMGNMLAIFAPGIKSEFVECFVLDLNDPTSNWRGDVFLNVIEGAVKRYDADAHARCKSQLKSIKSIKKL